MRDKWDYGVRCIYGIRAKPPRQVGQIAIETVHVGAHSKDMEVSVGRRRHEIGRVDVRDLRRSDAPWETVYTEPNAPTSTGGAVEK